MAYAVCSGILDGFYHTIRSGMYVLALEWVGMQCETVSMLVEASRLSEKLSGELPKLLVESIQDVAAIYADLLDDFLIEVVEQLLSRILLSSSNLGFELVLQLIKFKLDLLRRPALLVDGR